MNIIGFSGKIGCGKTTMADMLCTHVPGSKRLAFADALRLEVARFFGFKPEFVRSPAFKDCHFRWGERLVTGRQVLQEWGTEIRRAAEPGYWVRQMHEALGALEAIGVPLVVVDDVRFPDEAACVQQWDGFMIRINPYHGWEPGANATHASETALDEWDGFDADYRPAFGGLDAVVEEILGMVGR